jgi:predicted DCC family thiol-disulfide oxidoreductase YuxK
MEPGRDVILYDGVCGLCNRVVQLVLRRDRAGRFRFASLQSEFAHAALARYGRDANDLDTLYVLVDHGGPNERLLGRSRAALHIHERLGGVWRLAALLHLMPTPLLDRAYAVVVRNRYRLFGRSETCLLPRPEDAHRFIAV